MIKKNIGQAVVNAAKTVGFKMLKEKTEIENGFAYDSAITPVAKYAPWLNDESYNAIYKEVLNNTLITEKKRAYELWQLSLEVGCLDGDYIEIGSWKGGSGALIAKAANQVSPNSKIYLCDTFEGVVKASEHDNNYIGGEHSDTSKEIVEQLVNRLDLKNVHILKGIYPDDTGKFVANNKFKFCHIDVDVYEGAKMVTESIWNQMVIGGVIIFDDFGFQRMQGVTKFVESQRGMNDRLVIHNLNGHGIIIKVK